MMTKCPYMAQDRAKLMCHWAHQRPDIDKIYLFAIDPFKSKYQLLINWRDKVEIKHEKISKALIDYSQTTDKVYENLEHHHSTQKRKMLIVFDYMIAHIEANKKSPIVTEYCIVHER